MKREIKSKLKYFNYATIACLFVIILWGLNLILPGIIYGSGLDLKNFGEQFGATNALFSGLAFALLIIALIMQKEELELQRLELSQTRKEMKEQTKQFTIQNEINNRQNRERALYEMLNHFNQIVNNLEDSPKKHKLRDTFFLDSVYGYTLNDFKRNDMQNDNLKFLDCRDLTENIYQIYKEHNIMNEDYIVIKLGKGLPFLRNLYLNIKGALHYHTQIKSNITLDLIYGNIENHFNQYGYLLEIYFNQIFYICRFIQTSNTNLKNTYRNLFHSTLSSREMVLIFYFTFYYCKRENSREYFDLLVSGGLIKKLNKELLYNQNDFKIIVDFIDKLKT